MKAALLSAWQKQPNLGAFSAICGIMCIVLLSDFVQGGAMDVMTFDSSSLTMSTKEPWVTEIKQWSSDPAGVMLQQSEAYRRPVSNVDDAGRTSIRFDGENDWLMTDDVGLQGVKDVTVTVVMRRNAPLTEPWAGVYAFFGDSDSEGCSDHQGKGGFCFTFYDLEDKTGFDSTQYLSAFLDKEHWRQPFNANTFHIFTLRLDQGNASQWLDGELVGIRPRVQTDGVGIGPRFVIGARHESNLGRDLPGKSAPVDILELQIHQGALTDEQMYAATTALRRKHCLQGNTAHYIASHVSLQDHPDLDVNVDVDKAKGERVLGGISSWPNLASDECSRTMGSLTQSDSTRRPSNVIDASNRSVVRFDGQNDWLWTSDVDVKATHRTITLVMKVYASGVADDGSAIPHHNGSHTDGRRAGCLAFWHGDHQDTSPFSMHGMALLAPSPSSATTVLATGQAASMHATMPTHHPGDHDLFGVHADYNVWTLSYGDGNATIWMNGGLANQTTCDECIFGPNFVIGARHADYGPPSLPARMDVLEMRIDDRRFSDQEIIATANDLRKQHRLKFSPRSYDSGDDDTTESSSMPHALPAFNVSSLVDHGSELPRPVQVAPGPVLSHLSHLFYIDGDDVVIAVHASWIATLSNDDDRLVLLLQGVPVTEAWSFGTSVRLEHEGDLADVRTMMSIAQLLNEMDVGPFASRGHVLARIDALTATLPFSSRFVWQPYSQAFQFITNFRQRLEYSMSSESIDSLASEIAICRFPLALCTDNPDYTCQMQVVAIEVDTRMAFAGVVLSGVLDSDIGTSTAQSTKPKHLRPTGLPEVFVRDVAAGQSKGSDNVADGGFGEESLSCRLVMRSATDWEFVSLNGDGDGCVVYRVVGAYGPKAPLGTAAADRTDNEEKVGLVTATNDEQFAAFVPTILNHLCYARRFNYSYFVARSRPEHVPNRSLYYVKFAAIEAVWDAGMDIGIWLDRDATFQFPFAFDTALMDYFNLIQDHRGHASARAIRGRPQDGSAPPASLLITGWKTLINTGIFGVRSSVWGRQLLKLAWESSSQGHYLHHPAEQMAVVHAVMLQLADPSNNGSEMGVAAAPAFHYHGECLCKLEDGNCYGEPYGMACFDRIAEHNNVTDWTRASFPHIVVTPMLGQSGKELSGCPMLRQHGAIGGALDTAANGTNGMPPRGVCLEEVTEWPPDKRVDTAAGLLYHTGGGGWYRQAHAVLDTTRQHCGQT